MEKTKVEKKHRRGKPPPEWADYWHPNHFGCQEYVFHAKAWLSKDPKIQAAADQIRAKLDPIKFALFTGGRWGRGFPPKSHREPHSEGFAKRPWWFAVRVTGREFVLLLNRLHELRGTPDASQLHLALVADPTDIAKYMPECELLEAYRIGRAVCQKAAKMLEERGYGPEYEVTTEDWWNYNHFTETTVGMGKHSTGTNTGVKHGYRRQRGLFRGGADRQPYPGDGPKDD